MWRRYFEHANVQGTMQERLNPVPGSEQRMELDIQSETDGKICVITLDGEVDVYTAPRLKEALIEQIESGCVNVLVNMEDVGFIDSSGLGVLVGGLRRAKERSGTIRLVCTRENILKVFRITGLDKVFPIFSTTEEAREF